MGPLGYDHVSTVRNYEMPKSISKGKGFRNRAGRAQNGIALIFDLEGFSKFFNQPDVHEYIPTYLNIVTDAVESCIFGGKCYWSGSEELNVLQIDPVHKKFLGDGVLYVWTPPKGEDTFSINFITILANRLWNLKNAFGEVNKACADFVPEYELPLRIRFGLARGTVYELSVARSKEREYIGYCINLASRLQNYCPQLGFIASARLAIPESDLKEHGYIRTVANKIKGFPKEIVIVDGDEYAELDDEVRSELFQNL